MVADVVKVAGAVWCVTLGFAVLMSALVPASGAEAGEAKASVLERLGSSDFLVRREATDELLRDNQIDVKAIETLYSQATGEEQRQRLKVVARHHMLRLMGRKALAVRPRGTPGRKGFIGVELERFERASPQGPPTQVVRVKRTFCGFPGFAYLRHGDGILAMDGRPVASVESFTGQIKKKGPRKIVQLKLRRNGRTHAVRFVLADLEAAGNLYERNAMTLRPAVLETWQDLQRSLDAVAPRPPALGVNIQHVDMSPRQVRRGSALRRLRRPASVPHAVKRR